MTFNWQYGLLILGVLWGLQVVGTILQMRHYRTVLHGVTARWRDGYVGTGAAHASLGRGVIAILVTDGDQHVREALVMQGRTVFAKFRRLPELDGCSLAQVREGVPFKGGNVRLAKAFAGCVGQIEGAAA